MSYEIRPLTEREANVLISIMLLLKKDPAEVKKMYEEVRSVMIVAEILEKRIKVFKLPEFSCDALLVLCLFSLGNPGRVVLSLIETMEAYDKFSGKIDLEFIVTRVYPNGIYTDKGFGDNWDHRKANFDIGYNPLIVTRE